MGWGLKPLKRGFGKDKVTDVYVLQRISEGGSILDTFLHQKQAWWLSEGCIGRWNDWKTGKRKEAIEHSDWAEKGKYVEREKVWRQERVVGIEESWKSYACSLECILLLFVSSCCCSIL